MGDISAIDGHTRQERYPKPYRRYVVTVILLVYVFNQLDRGVFNILMEPIKRQFSLTDTQLGFVTGPALVILYSLLGVPVARWADRTSRVRIMSTAVALWSVVTTLTATVSQFWELALARIGVGIGAAGFSAVAISVIGDYETDKNRPRAISYFMLAMPIAFLISNLMGGWVNQLYGWRWVFVIAGMPGILLALLMRTTVREPPRRLMAESAELHRPHLRVAFSTLWRRRSLRHLAIAQATGNAGVNAMGWVYVLFIRQHHMSTGELGSWLAFTDGLGPFVGIWLSGMLAARLGARDAGRATTRLMALTSTLVVPLALFVLWCPSKPLALLGYLLLNIPMYFFFGPTAALVQDLVGPSMRATMASVFILVQMLAGSLIGTQLVGILSDRLAPLVGDPTLALRWSMTVGSMMTLLAALHFWRAGPFVSHDRQAQRTWEAQGAPAS